MLSLGNRPRTLIRYNSMKQNRPDPGKEQKAESRAQEVYGVKYSLLPMYDSKKTVSRMLHEDMARRAVRRLVRQAQKE